MTMIIEIKNRFTGSVLFSTGVDDSDERPVRTAVMRAVSARANLADANLARADLSGANLAVAYLSGANLSDADLSDAYIPAAYLARADLARANLSDANLTRTDLYGSSLAFADLAGANLARANLARACLADTYLDGTNLARACLKGAYLDGAELSDAYLDPQNPYVRQKPGPGALAERAKRYRDRHPDVPVVENLDAKILDAVTSGGGHLKMSEWHTCETTHCRAGWAIHLAGKAGYKLEQKLHDPQRAGAAIYRASTGRIPHFFATDRAALEDIKRCAAEQQEVP